MENLLAVIIASMLPISELRGGIPLGIGLGLDPFLVILISIIANCFVFFPVYFGLKFFYERFLNRFKFVRKYLEKAQKKGKPYIDKYGITGLVIFIGIPLPFTGVWTGTAAAWILGLNWKKSFIAACAGALIASSIVSAICLGILKLGPELVKLFVKN